MENEVQNEALTLQQRRKRGMQLRRRKSRIKRQKALQMRRFAGKSRIQNRAKRGARNILKKRFSGGKSYNKLSSAQKMTVDKRAEKMKKMVGRLATRLVPTFRRKEIERRRGPRSEDLDLDLQFQDLFMENNDGPEYDGLDMADAQLDGLLDDVEVVLEKLEMMDEEPDEWILQKITLAADYMSTVRDYLEFYDDDEDDDEEDDYYSESEIIEAFLESGKESFSKEELDELGGFFEEYSSLQKKSQKNNIPFEIVLEVYNRGLDSYTEERFKTPQQVAFTRVNSFLSGGDVDEDLHEKILEYGTDDSRIYYARTTPGQNPDIVTMKYSADAVLNALNDVNTQRIKKLHEEIDEEFSSVFNGGCECDDCECDDHELVITESEYQGKKVELNNPFRLPSGSNKKFGVYVKNDKGNVVKVTFGDPNMEIKRDDPERRKSFRARHGCDNPGPKWKANYWSCYQWRASAKVDN